MSPGALVEPLEGFAPEVGRWLGAMEQFRRRTLRGIDGIDQATIDWEGPDGKENAIGSLLYHIALYEAAYGYDVIRGVAWPAHLAGDFPYDASDELGRLTRVLDVPLTDHIRRLSSSRAAFLESFKVMSVSEWSDTCRVPANLERDRVGFMRHEGNGYSPAWVAFHMLEHEAQHAGQIRSLRARARRLGISS